MIKCDFEKVLCLATASLNSMVLTAKFSSSKQFEDAVRGALEIHGRTLGVEIDYHPHPHAFPDIVIGGFGVEVKFSDKDTWRCIANSVFEGRRNSSVEHVYLIFGKMGGTPEVKWADYASSVVHVRTSHVPRFEVDLSGHQSLFAVFGVSYLDFQKLTPDKKMEHVRNYARGRLKNGERLWWLDSGQGDDDHTLPIQARLYTSLTTAEKRRMRGEAALLSPSIVQQSGTKQKYDAAALYLLTYHGVLCTQIRDLFSAGSVAMRSDETRGGHYIERALRDIEPEMKAAALNLEMALFEEYWGETVDPENRIRAWLKQADDLAKPHWVPSKTLFR